MDITTLVGWVLAAVLIVNGIGVAKLGNFYDVPSIQIVLGGTMASLIACYPLRMLKDIPKHIGICFKGKAFDCPKVIDQIVDLAMVARRDGLLALEDKASDIKDPFFKQAILMIVDANDPDKVRALLEKECDDKAVRHEEVRGMYLKGSAMAPAFGMIGTLVGLINMLKGLDLSGGGSSTLGQDMSVALITTFYGSTLSNVIFHPIAQKLSVRENEEELYDSIIIDGVLAIQAGENPKYIREHLIASLPGKQQAKLLASEPGAGAANAGGEQNG